MTKQRVVRQRVPGSLQYDGKTLIAVSRPTRAGLWEVAKANDLELSKLLRGIALGELEVVKSERHGSGRQLSVEGFSPVIPEAVSVKAEVVSMRSELHKMTALMALVLSGTVLTLKPNEVSPVINNLADGMNEVENILLSHIAALPGESKALLRRVLAKAGEVEPVVQNKMELAN